MARPAATSCRTTGLGRLHPHINWRAVTGPRAPLVRIDNGWRWYVRLVQPQTRLAAITSRPMRLHGVARLTRHGRQSRLLLTLAQVAGAWIKERMAHIRAGLKQVLATARHRG